MLSCTSRSGVDPDTAIRARRSPGTTQQVCSDKAGPRLGQETQTAGPGPDQDQEGKKTGTDMPAYVAVT